MKLKTFVAFAACAAFGSLGQPAFALTDWTVDFRCDAMTWTSGPTIAGGIFDGKLESECHFKANQGGTLAQLETALSREVMDKADTVHSGPTASTFDSLPATYLDVTSLEKMDSMEARVRADVNFATDGTTRFLNSTVSKEIKASGMAKNLKSIVAGFEIRPEANGEYVVRFHNQIQITKPSLVPTSLFKSEVMKGMEAQSKTRRESLITKFSETL